MATISDKKIKYLRALALPLELYHRHKAVGVEHVPSKGPCLIVVNHSLATYDILLLCKSILDIKGRITRPLMDRWFFTLPGLGEFMESIGAVEGSRDAARKLLVDEQQIVCVAPGGMKEAVRPSGEKYQINWQNRLGFARMAILTQSPVVLAACPKADDIFDVANTKTLTSLFYETLRVPFVLFRGIGLTPIPKPVQLTHYLSPQIFPPKPMKSKKALEKQVQDFHDHMEEEMRNLLKQGFSSDLHRASET